MAGFTEVSLTKMATLSLCLINNHQFAFVVFNNHQSVFFFQKTIFFERV